MNCVFAVLLLVGVASANWCGSSGGSVKAVAKAKAVAVDGGVATASAIAKVELSKYQGFFCFGDVSAAADAFALAVGSGAVADAVATAEAFAEACGVDAIAAADAAALAFKGKAEAEAVAVAKTLGLAHKSYYPGVVANAAASAFAKAVGDGYLSGVAAAKSFADAYAQAGDSGYAFVIATADAAAKANCGKFKQVLADTYTFALANTGYGGFGVAASDAEASAECLKNCCGCKKCL